MITTWGKQWKEKRSNQKMQEEREREREQTVVNLRESAIL